MITCIMSCEVVWQSSMISLRLSLLNQVSLRTVSPSWNPKEKVAWINVWAVGWPYLSTVLMTQKKRGHSWTSDFMQEIRDHINPKIWDFATLWLYPDRMCYNEKHVVKYKAVSCFTKAEKFSLSVTFIKLLHDSNLVWERADLLSSIFGILNAIIFLITSFCSILEPSSLKCLVCLHVCFPGALLGVKMSTKSSHC